MRGLLLPRGIVVALRCSLRERSRRSHHRDTRWHSDWVSRWHATSRRITLRHLIAWVAHGRDSRGSSGRIELPSRVMRLLRVACRYSTWRWVCWCRSVYLFHFYH